MLRNENLCEKHFQQSRSRCVIMAAHIFPADVTISKSSSVARHMPWKAMTRCSLSRLQRSSGASNSIWVTHKNIIEASSFRLAFAFCFVDNRDFEAGRLLRHREFNLRMKLFIIFLSFSIHSRALAAICHSIIRWRCGEKTLWVAAFVEENVINSKHEGIA